MRVKCFGCHERIEGEHADAVVQSFLEHGNEYHTWSAPEQALRNYARNCAEAEERLSMETE